MGVIGIANFAGGETLQKRVLEESPRKMKVVGGYDFSTGSLLPDKLPTRVSTTGLGGTIPAQIPFAYRDATGVRIICRDANEKLAIMGVDGAWDPAGDWQTCTVALATDLVSCTGHGYSAGDAIQFSAATGGMTVGTTYYVIASGLTADVFKFSTAAGGSAFNITADGSNTVASILGATVDVLADSAPFRVDGLVVFATGGANSKLMSFEPDSTSDRTRPFSFKGPQDYDKTAKPTVAVAAWSGTRLFDCDDANVWTAAGTGTTVTNTGTSYADLAIGPTGVASQQCMTKSLAAATKNFVNYSYLILDLQLRDGDPQAYENAGLFANDSAIFPSGYELGLYSDTACTTLVKKLTIPNLQPNGAIIRCCFNIADIESTIQGIAILSASYFLAPATPSWMLRVWSESFAPTTLECKTNQLVLELSTHTNRDSPWQDDMPPEYAVSTSCVVLQRFDELEALVEEKTPWVKYAYCFRGRDQLGTEDYRVMISNPSIESTKVASLPWNDGLQTITVTLPSSGGDDVMDDYGNYVEYALIYRDIYDPATLAWDGWKFWKALDMAASMSYVNAACACTVANSGDLITDNAHGLVEGEAVKFTATTGGFETDRTYYIITPTTNTFQVSEDPDGTAFAITADGSNVYYIVNSDNDSPTIDGDDVPPTLEANHEYLASARFGMISLGRVYAANNQWDNTNSHWDLPKTIRVSNDNDLSSFPTTTSDPPSEADGEMLEGQAPSAYNILGCVAYGAGKLIFYDNCFQELQGDDPISGWDFVHRDDIGLKDAAMISTGRLGVEWHDGTHFYLWNGGLSEPTSKGLIDGALIDWTVAHGSVYSNDRNVIFCHYDDPDADQAWCLIIHDLTLGSWRRRHATSYELAGICTADAAGTVYGLTHDGDIVNLFGGTTGYGESSVVYDVWTQNLIIAPPNEVRHVSRVLADLYTTRTAGQGGADITIDLTTHGKLDQTATQITQNVVNTQTQYRWRSNLTADAVSMRFRHTGAYPPEIYFLGLDVDEGSGG